MQFFLPHEQSRGGINTTCRACVLVRKNEWKKRTRERRLPERRLSYAEDNGASHKQLEKQRRQRHPHRVNAEYLLNGLRSRVRKHGYECAPELQSRVYVENWLKGQPNCECCGCELKSRADGGLSGPQDASPTFDRFDLSKGYTLANTALICWRCNNIKRNYTELDLLQVATWIVKRRAQTKGRKP